MNHGLWGIVSKTEAEPEAGTERHTKFVTRRDRALAIIVLSVRSISLTLSTRRPNRSCRHMGESLSSQFQKKTWANRLALRKRLHSMLLKDGQNVQEHVKNMVELFNELAIVGDNISDEDRVVYLLASLPESFDVLVTALEASTTVPQMETVIERLLHTERKLKDKDLTDTEGAMSLKHKRRGPRCHHCGKFGHIQRNCRDRKKEEKPQNSDAEHHHRRPNYKPKQKANSAEIREQESSSSEEVGLVHQHVFAAGGVNEPTQSGTQWIIDSGATSHICSDRSLFTDLKKLNHPLDVVLGDGRALIAKHSGTVHLQVKSGSLTRKCKLHNVLFVPELAYCLLSISKVTERGIEFKFNKRGCIVRDSNGRLITVASKSGHLFQVSVVESKNAGVRAVSCLERRTVAQTIWTPQHF